MDLGRVEDYLEDYRYGSLRSCGALHILVDTENNGITELCKGCQVEDGGIWLNSTKGMARKLSLF